MVQPMMFTNDKPIFQQMADQPRVSAFRYPLPAIVKIIIVICKAKRYAANNKG